MGVEKMSVSFDLELGEAIRESAGEHGSSVSSWLAEAARDRLRRDALQWALDDWQKEFGAFTPEEIAEANRKLDRAAALRQPGAA